MASRRKDLVYLRNNAGILEFITLDDNREYAIDIGDMGIATRFLQLHAPSLTLPLIPTKKRGRRMGNPLGRQELPLLPSDFNDDSDDEQDLLLNLNATLHIPPAFFGRTIVLTNVTVANNFLEFLITGSYINGKSEDTLNDLLLHANLYYIGKTHRIKKLRIEATQQLYNYLVKIPQEQSWHRLPPYGLIAAVSFIYSHKDQDGVDIERMKDWFVTYIVRYFKTHGLHENEDLQGFLSKSRKAAVDLCVKNLHRDFADSGAAEVIRIPDLPLDATSEDREFYDFLVQVFNDNDDATLPLDDTATKLFFQNGHEVDQEDPSGYTLVLDGAYSDDDYGVISDDESAFGVWENKFDEPERRPLLNQSFNWRNGPSPIAPEFVFPTIPEAAPRTHESMPIRGLRSVAEDQYEPVSHPFGPRPGWRGASPPRNPPTPRPSSPSSPGPLEGLGQAWYNISTRDRSTGSNNAANENRMDSPQTSSAMRVAWGAGEPEDDDFYYDENNRLVFSANPPTVDATTQQTCLPDRTLVEGNTQWRTPPNQDSGHDNDDAGKSSDTEWEVLP